MFLFLILGKRINKKEERKRGERGKKEGAIGPPQTRKHKLKKKYSLTHMLYNVCFSIYFFYGKKRVKNYKSKKIQWTSRLPFCLRQKIREEEKKN
jgi:hypothetical protein